MTWAVSASATALSVPIVSKSHWTNSRNRPLAGRSPRKTEPMAYRLNGVPSSSMCLATNRASGTVRSNRRASSPGVPPLLVTSKICRSTSSDPAPFPVRTSIRSICGRLDRHEAELAEGLAERRRASARGGSSPRGAGLAVRWLPGGRSWMSGFRKGGCRWRLLDCTILPHSPDQRSDRALSWRMTPISMVGRDGRLAPIVPTPRPPAWVRFASSLHRPRALPQGRNNPQSQRSRRID